jgi:hypothetical protein
MLAPGVPSAAFAEALTEGPGWAQRSVDATMHVRYGTGADAYHPAAAFDVFDLDPKKISTVRSAVGDFNAQVYSAASGESKADIVHDLRSDFRTVRGMVRFDHSARMPWHADRPAIAAYDTVAADGRLPDAIRAAATRAAEAIGDLVLAHKESGSFGPFHSSYADAVGPTIHLPITRQLYDSWADQGVVETHNDFFDAVNGKEFARVIGAYNRAEDAAGAAVAA